MKKHCCCTVSVTSLQAKMVESYRLATQNYPKPEAYKIFLLGMLVLLCDTMKSKLNHIVILEGETRSGKTTTLQNYFKGKPNVRGFLTPDLNGVRKLYTLSDDAFHEFEAASGEADKTIAIGRFHFYKDAFETGRNALQDFPKKLTFWMLVDE